MAGSTYCACVARCSQCAGTRGRRDVRPNRFWVTLDWANHGTPHDYDARVPILFWGAPFTPGRFGGRVRVVDIAPTLADVLGITPTEALDGRVPREILHQR